MKKELLVNVRVKAISQEDLNQYLLFRMRLALHLRYLLMEQSEKCSFDQSVNSVQCERKPEIIKKKEQETCTFED